MQRSSSIDCVTFHVWPNGRPHRCAIASASASDTLSPSKALLGNQLNASDITVAFAQVSNTGSVRDATCRLKDRPGMAAITPPLRSMGGGG